MQCFTNYRLSAQCRRPAALCALRFRGRDVRAHHSVFGALDDRRDVVAERAAAAELSGVLRAALPSRQQGPLLPLRRAPTTANSTEDERPAFSRSLARPRWSWWRDETDSAVLLLAAVSLAACEQNMDVQPKYSEYSQGAGVSRQRPAHVRRPALSRGTIPRASRPSRDKPALTAALLDRGRERFGIFCSALSWRRRRRQRHHRPARHAASDQLS